MNTNENERIELLTKILNMNVAIWNAGKESKLDRYLSMILTDFYQKELEALYGYIAKVLKRTEYEEKVQRTDHN